MEKSYKSISKELSTFSFLGKKNIIDYKTKTVNEKEVIVEKWCKVCAKNKNEIKSSVK